MVFKRRKRAPFFSRLRELIAPRKGFWRGFGYIGKRMRRVPDTPHRIALGFACGALVSFSPFFGFHFFLAAGLAWLMRGNILAGLFGTAVGNPFSFPFIAFASLWTGRTILGVEGNALDFEAIQKEFGDAFGAIWDWTKSLFGYANPDLSGLSTFFDNVFLPYLIGGIIPGALCAAVFYALIVPVVGRYQERRRKRLEEVQAQHRRALEDELNAYRSRDGRAGDSA